MQHFCLGSHNRKLPTSVEGKFICSQKVGHHNKNFDEISLSNNFRPPAILCPLLNIIKVFPSVCLIGQDYLVSGQPNKPLLNVWQVHPMESTDIPHRANFQVNRSEQIPLRLFTPGPVSSLATSPSGSYLAAAVQESITIWQIGTGCPAVQSCANIFTLSYQGPCWLCCPGTTSLWLSSPSPKTEVISSVEGKMGRFS